MTQRPGPISADEEALDQARLPDASSWAAALVRLERVLGEGIGERARSAENLALFGQKVTNALKTHAPRAEQLVAVLNRRLEDLGIIDACDRRTTAASAKALCDALAGKSALSQALSLAEAKLETSPDAVRASLASAHAVTALLENEHMFGIWLQLAAREQGDAQATRYAEEARAVLCEDELATPLVEHLEALAIGGQALLLESALRPAAVPAEAVDDMDATSMLHNWVSDTSLNSLTLPVLHSPVAPIPPVAPVSPRPQVPTVAPVVSTVQSPGVVVVHVEQHGGSVNRSEARATLAKALKDAEQRLNATTGRVALVVSVTLDVDADEGDRGKGGGGP